MKPITTLLLLLPILLSACTAGANEKERSDDWRPKDRSWELSWSDEFDGEEIDWSVWSKTPRHRSDWNNYMSEAEELYAIREGKLVLRGIANSGHPEDSARYLTGGIWGKGKQHFTMGRIDVRARFDSGGGFWPAIWMLGEDAGWPVGGEIDLMEHLNRDDIVYQTVHSGYTQAGNKTNPAPSVTTPIDISAFNIYSVEVHQNELVFLVNDSVTHSYPRLDPAAEHQFPFRDRDFYVILSAQLGGSWVGAVDPDDLPVEMEIDWVRYYRNKE
jgi:beta-glucanase (GH16 family)